MLKLTEVKSKF